MTNLKKSLFLIIVLSFFSGAGYAQEKKLVDFLNKSLTKEISQQNKSPEVDGETISVVKPYKISEGKILSLVIKKSDSYSGRSVIITQEVPLSKIRQIVKDINVIFTTEGEDVTVTTVTEGEDSDKTVDKSDMFWTQFYLEKNNEEFGKKMEEYLKKAHYDVTLDIWAD